MGRVGLDALDSRRRRLNGFLSIRLPGTTVRSANGRLDALRNDCVEPHSGRNRSLWTDAGGTHGADLAIADGNGFVPDAKTQPANIESLFPTSSGWSEFEGLDSAPGRKHHRITINLSHTMFKIDAGQTCVPSPGPRLVCGRTGTTRF